MVNERKTFTGKVIGYYGQIWNLVDLTALLVFTAGFILRFIPNSSDCFMAARYLNISSNYIEINNWKAGSQAMFLFRSCIFLNRFLTNQAGENFPLFSLVF